MVKVIAKISSRAGMADQLRQVLTALVVPSRDEPGCLGYEMFQDEEDPVEFVAVENWADAEAAAAHMNTAHVAEAIAKATDWLAQPPVIHRYKRLG